MSANINIHQDIDELLAADLHNELSESERETLHRHLVECADCRHLHKEYKAMNTLLEEKFSDEKPDAAFEQRVLSRFRDKVPEKHGFVSSLTNLMRFRATQLTAVAALLLALLQVGRMITGDGSLFRQRPLAYLEGAGPRAMTATPAAFARPQSKTLSERHRSLQKDGVGSKPAPPPASFSAGLPPQTLAAKASDAESEDITRLGVRSSTDLVQKVPAATGAEGENQQPTPANPIANRKLIRNATVELEIVTFDQAVQRITAFANEDRGYIATTNSEKQENGKLRGEIVVKVLPENLDRFLGKLRGLGELKNQNISTEDVTKAYFDTDSRLKNARVMEQRLVDILKKKSDDINDLLQVEKELGRVRQEIEQMQGDLKFMDSQVQFATVTITLAEKDMNVPAAFLLTERAELALYAPDVEKVYTDIKAVASPKVQITRAQLDRDNAGRVSARVSMLIAPEESDAVIANVKEMGRVENFQVQTERIAQGGEGMSENAKTERDKVQLNISLSRDEQEQALQQTSLRIRTGAVDAKTKELRTLAEKQGGRVRSSSFNRDTDGSEFANVTLRVPMKNYAALMQSLDSLGRVENVSIQRQDQTGARIDEANAPADLSVQVYSQGNVVSQQSGLFFTLRRTIAQGASALMWSVRMIGVALAFFAPWVIALAVVIWIVRRVRRARPGK